jgi:hypothetical protein
MNLSYRTQALICLFNAAMTAVLILAVSSTSGDTVAVVCATLLGTLGWIASAINWMARAAREEIEDSQ